jgi:hypothetical protein
MGCDKVGDEDHRLVSSQRLELRPASVQAAAAAENRQCEKVVVVCRLSSRDNLVEHRQRVVRPAGLHQVHGVGQSHHRCQVWVSVSAVHQPPEPLEPARGLRVLASVAEVEPDPEHAPRRLLGQAAIEILALGTIAQRDELVVLADQVGSHRPALEDRLAHPGARWSARQTCVVADPVVRRCGRRGDKARCHASLHSQHRIHRRAYRPFQADAGSSTPERAARRTA